jgi:hypothetical protein
MEDLEELLPSRGGNSFVGHFRERVPRNAERQELQETSLPQRNQISVSGS